MCVYRHLQGAGSRCHVCSQYSLPVLLGQCLSRVSPIWLDWLTGKATGSIPSLMLGLWSCATMHDIYMCAGHLSSGPHGHTAGMLSTEPSPQWAALKREFQCLQQVVTVGTLKHYLVPCAKFTERWDLNLISDPHGQRRPGISRECCSLLY